MFGQYKLQKSKQNKHTLFEMLAFTEITKMADVILKDYRLLPIISRFGIKLGFGNKTVEDVCRETDIDVAFFLEILNSYHNPSYFPNNHLIDFRADVVVKYLTNTHAYYLSSKVPYIEGCIKKMEEEASTEASRNIALLQQFFQDYRDELEEHFQVEEKGVFPYILALEQALKHGDCTDLLIQKIRKEPIEIYERNHDNLEIKLADMKNLIIRFLPPLHCEDECEHLLTELFQLENDLIDHTKIEEKVLIPKVKKLEQKVLECYAV